MDKFSIHKAMASNTAMTRRNALGCLVAAGAAIPLLGACTAPMPPMRVGSIVFPGYELMFLAREMGLLDEKQVHLIELRSNTDTMRALASGQLEAAAMTLDEMMSARSDGVDLRVVLIFDVSAGADVVLARKNVTLQSLKGTRIATEEGAMGAVMLSALLQAAGLQLQQVRKVDMTLDQSEDIFKSGRADVVVSAEPWASRLEKLGARRIFDSTTIPGRIVDVLAVRGDIMESHASCIRQVIAAHFTARRLFLAEPVKASVAIAGRLQTPASEVVDQYRGLKLPDAKENFQMMRPGGTFDRTALELQQVMLASNLLSKPMALQALSDTR